MATSRVAVIFEPGKRPKPKWFTLDGQKVQVTDINYYWENYEGSAKLEHYSVTTDTAGLCELIYNTRDMVWDAVRRGDNILKK